MQNSLVPLPPTGALVDPRVEFWLTLVNVIVGLIWVGYAVFDWRRSGKATYLLILLSGAAMCSIEPFIDTVGACWFPNNTACAFKFYGRPMPYWLIFSYLNYFGAAAAVMWQKMRNGMSRNTLWLFYAGLFIADVALEVALLPFKDYMYYGQQPLVVLHFPVWWAAINACTPIVLATVVTRFDEYFSQGWGPIKIIPAALTVTMAGNAAIGWPSWLVINTAVSPEITQLGGLVTLGLSVWTVSIVAQALNTSPNEPIEGQAVLH